MDPWDLGELGSLHPLLLPYSVRVGCCCCMKAFNSLSIHKVRNKEKESTEKKVEITKPNFQLVQAGTGSVTSTPNPG